ncbi:zinc-binding dehydrogenase [Massilia antarctica]|uniref:zinc-binding dehydrogenase n=1 Tax=Massilia antarctica TaxID=2765360 RepID=UPI0027D94F9D|nr:zinc-binding dehydrogenase [Massilia antarctica]
MRVELFNNAVMTLLSAGVRRKARQRGVSYAFRFMRAEGKQLGEIASLIDGGHIGAVIDRIFPFDETNAALDYVEAVRAKGKVVIKVS